MHSDFKMKLQISSFILTKIYGLKTLGDILTFLRAIYANPGIDN